MFTVKLDTSALAKQLGQHTSAVLTASLASLQEYTRHRISDLIKEKVNPEQQAKYESAIELVETKNTVTFQVTDEEVIRLETGSGRFDIKTGLLASAKAKKSASGEPYIDVPFQHRTTKRGKGTYVDDTDPKTANNMRQAVNAASKIVQAKGGVQRLFKGLKGESRKKFKDMRVAMESVAGKLTAAARTFRRVSKNTATDKWWHPGFKGLSIFEIVYKDVDSIKDKVIQDTAKSLGYL